MEDVGLFYGHFVVFISWFGMLYQEKAGNPGVLFIS
jgi:hypothetical protein